MVSLFYFNLRRGKQREIYYVCIAVIRILMSCIKRYLHWVLIILLFQISLPQLEAQTPLNSEIAEIAGLHIRSYFPSGIWEIESVSGTGTKSSDLVYLVDLKPEGWILVSGDKGAEPVIGFSYTDKFYLPESDPSNSLYLWIRAYEEQISALKEEAADKEHPGWKSDYYSSLLKSSQASAVNISPLINAKWNQGTGWNIYCPDDPEGPGGHAYVGCTAVAMGQAMTPFMTPGRGTGFHYYIHDVYDSLFANFGETTYYWELMKMNMPDTYNALLLYHCAVSVNMDFGPDCSSSYSSATGNALKTYFGYSRNIIYKRRSNYPASWSDMLINELSAGRPLIYRGSSDDGESSHAFNIDGVIESKYFHLNWGWGGKDNGFFLIDDLTPGTRDYTISHGAVFNIQPYYYPTDIILSNYIVPEDEPPGVFIGKVSVVDEATDNEYTMTFRSDSTFSGGEFVHDYYIENDSLKTGRTFPAGEIIRDTVWFSLADAHGNFLEVAAILTFETTSGSSTQVDNRRIEAFRIYPNPAGDLLFINDNNENWISRIKIYSLSGQIVRYFDSPPVNSGLSISGLRKGLYILEATYDDGFIIRKKVIKN